MQPLLRNLRRVLRSASLKMIDAVGFNARLNGYASEIAWVYELNGNHPGFLIDRMKRLIAVTLRAVETEAYGMLFRILKRLISLMKKILCMQQGRVRGKQSTTTCSICLQENGCSWWVSKRCGHCFHVQCIAKCFDTDERCPLCRNDHWRVA